MSTQSEIKLTMNRHFKASPESVFQTWLNSDLFKNWLFTLAETNKVAVNEPIEGGTWEIVDHRDGVDYRAIGKYLEVSPPTRLVFTFKMPQFSEAEDVISVEFESENEGCKMTFIQMITVPHEDDWNHEDIEKTVKEHYDGSKHGWSLMFKGLQQIVEK